MSLKYKVGDKVKIIDLKGFQEGRVKIGDIVTITIEHPGDQILTTQ